jgi:tRNA A37 N6-isopentenylltransferase MiaA
MQRILLLSFCVLVSTAAAARADIEIYANGQRYASLQAYIEAREAGELDPKIHKLFVLGVENGVIEALQDFYQSRTQEDLPQIRTIPLSRLQQYLKQTISMSKDPKLVIAQPGKVRILTLAPQDSGQ